MQRLNMIWVRHYGACERRGLGRRPVEWGREGWLQLEESPDEPTPVILLDFSTVGVGLVLFVHDHIHPGQWRFDHPGPWCWMQSSVCALLLAEVRSASLAAAAGRSPF